MPRPWSTTWFKLETMRIRIIQRAFDACGFDAVDLLRCGVQADELVEG